MSAEIVVMSEDEARRLTERIRIAIVNFTEAKAKVLTLVQQAQDGQAWAALGFPSWTAYIADVFSDEPLRLARDDRREMVTLLFNTGMSTRAIAPVVGASQMTVQRDVRAAGESSDSPEPVEIAGRDGKTYQRPVRDLPTPNLPPTPNADEIPDTKPRRTPITESFFNATVDLHTKAGTLTRLIADDRFPRNREEVARRNRNDLLNTITALNAVLAALDNQPNA